jgi:Mrp family chromosome partitioning ATPase/capsular polysaccharide biosynthesis protein
MRSEGFGALVSIARRSIWIIVLLVALGVIQMNVIRHAQGPEYAASAQVILAPTDLASAVSGLSTFVDPTLIDQTEQALADSQQLYQYAAGRNNRFGSAKDLEAATNASKSGSTITFTATSSTSARAVGTVNLVAKSYTAWRAAVSSRAIDRAIVLLQAQLPQSGSSKPDLLAQLSKLRVLKTLTSGNVLLVDTAESATKTRPSPVKDSLLGGFIGLFVALLVIGLREALDSKVRSEEETEEVLDVPVLGAIETLPRKVSSVISDRDAERYGDMYALLAASLVQQREGTQPTLIAVTSATAEEGKTTTAVNLAAALARRNARVKLLDLDTRRPSLARLLRIPLDEPGGEQVLLGRANVDSLLWEIGMNGSGPKAQPARAAARARLREGSSSLQVLPIRASAVHGLVAHAERLETLLREASAEADFVVIDTPPALSTPDVTELAKFVDIVLLVVRHGRVSRRNLQSLRRVHRTWPDVDVQAVLVGVPTDGSTYSYYSGA